MNNILLKDLMVTQDHARNLAQIPGMTEFVKGGGFFTREVLDAYAESKGIEPSPLFKLSVFEDGQIYIHDGHHRGASIFMAGRDYIREDEFDLKEWKYSDYTDTVFLDGNGDWIGWVTPLDVKSEMRLPELKEFKASVNDIYHNQSQEHAEGFINANPEKYKIKRAVYSVEDLVGSIDLEELLK